MGTKYPLPKSWKWVTLDDIGIVVSGGTPSTKEPEFWNGDISWITPADLSSFEDVYISKGQRNISQIGLEYSSAILLPKNSIIFSSRAPIGYVAITQNELATNQGFKNLILPKSINPKYAYYYLKTVKELAETMASGTTFLELSSEKFKKIPFPIAPIEEQNMIVDKIENSFININESITDLVKNISLIPAYRQLNIKKLIKNDGTSSALGDIAKFIDYRGRTPIKTKDGVRLITAKNVKNGFISFEPEEFISEDSYDEWMTRGLPKRGDIFITTEAPLGNVAEYNFDEKIALAQRIITLQPTPKIDGRYLKYFLMSSDFQKKLDTKGTGTTVKGIKSTTLKKMVINYPNIDDQLKIVSELDRLNSLTNKLEKELLESLDKAKALKSKILQFAYQGKFSAYLKSKFSIDYLLDEIKKEKYAYLKKQSDANKKYKRTERKKVNLLEEISKIYKCESFDFNDLLNKLVISHEKLEKDFDSLLDDSKLEKIYDNSSQSIKYRIK